MSACGSIIYACTYVRTCSNRYNVYCVCMFNRSNTALYLQHLYLIAEHDFDQCPVIGTKKSILFSARHLTDFSVNIAVGMDAYQSATTRWSATQGANGDRRGNLTMSGSCTTSPYIKSYRTNSWWKVDLRYVYDIKLVMFLNRGDCCGELYMKAYSVLIHSYTLAIISVRVLTLLVRHVGNTLRFYLEVVT